MLTEKKLKGILYDVIKDISPSKAIDKGMNVNTLFRTCRMACQKLEKKIIVFAVIVTACHSGSHRKSCTALQEFTLFPAERAGFNC